VVAGRLWGRQVHGYAQAAGRYCGERQQGAVRLGDGVDDGEPEA
jgi:hypothetical protein